MRLWRCSTMLSKTHRNLMHLKRKIYFSILTVVNFKINMEMRDQCFCHALSHFFLNWFNRCYASIPIVRWLFNFYEKISTSPSIFVCLTSNWCDSCFVFVHFSPSLPFLRHRFLRKYTQKTGALTLLFRTDCCSDIFSHEILSQFVCSRMSNMNEIIDILICVGIVCAYCLLFH